MKSSRKLEFTD